MVPLAALRWCAVVYVLILSLLTSPSFAIYCNEDDCYGLLGVSQNANASEIKKASYKLSLKYHPAKNPDPESRKLFVKIANAYEILKDEATWEQYDYAIAHPEEVFYNTAHYYHAYYGPKTDPCAVLIGLLLVLSVFQYLNSWTRYNQIYRLQPWSRRHQHTKLDCGHWNLNAVEESQIRRRATGKWIRKWRKISAKNLSLISRD